MRNWVRPHFLSQESNMTRTAIRLGCGVVAMGLLAGGAALLAGGAALSAQGGTPAFSADALMAHVKVLASDEFEGRAPGTRGEDRTVTYIADQFGKVGVKPGAADGTYLQNVPMAGITADPATSLTFAKGTATQTLKFKDDMVVWTKRLAPEVSLAASDVVFVGYGVEAPEFNWDDYKGVDLSGKTMVVLINDPPVPDPIDPKTLDAKTFGGRADLQRALDLQVRDGGGEEGRGGAHRARDRAGGVPVLRGAEQGHGTVRPGRPRQEHGPRRRRRLDHARPGEGALRDGRPGFRCAQGPGRDARLQARPVRCHGLGDVEERRADGELAQRRRAD
jgi:hypothetical protein